MTNIEQEIHENVVEIFGESIPEQLPIEKIRLIYQELYALESNNRTILIRDMYSGIIIDYNGNVFFDGTKSDLENMLNEVITKYKIDHHMIWVKKINPPDTPILLGITKNIYSVACNFEVKTDK